MSQTAVETASLAKADAIVQKAKRKRINSAVVKEIPQKRSAIKRYDWDDSEQIGKRAVNAVQNFLASKAAVLMWQQVKGVFDVANNSFHQKRDTDLLLIVKDSAGLARTSIEVKGDRNDHTGNLFFETIADIDRKKDGAFLVCEAEWFFYYFLNSGHLFCIRMSDAKPWFDAKRHLFHERDTSSQRKNRIWKTRGSLVPISLLKRELPSTWHFVYRGGWKRLD